MSRTAYLDDLNVECGDKVKCVHNISSHNFTMGKEYFVKKKFLAEQGAWFAGVYNDLGNWCIPSVRFIKF